jgi:hypothetical protein
MAWRLYEIPTVFEVVFGFSSMIMTEVAFVLIGVQMSSVNDGHIVRVEENRCGSHQLASSMKNL